MPKLREQRLNPLTHTTVQLSLVGHLSPRYQQQPVFFRKHIGKLRPVIAKVGQHHTAHNRFRQFRCRAAVIEIARSQDRIDNATVDVAQRVQFEAKKPARTAFAKISAFVAQQSHSAMTNGFADRDGLGVHQVKSTTAQKVSRLKQSADNRREAMQAGEPLLIRTMLGESRGKVIGNQLVSLFERSNTKKALHQADGDDFGISKSRRGIGRAAPVGQPGVRFKEVINEAVDFGHLVYNGRQMGRPPSVEMSFATTFYTSSELWRPSLSTQYSGLLRESFLDFILQHF